MSLTIFMISPATLFMLAAFWLTGAAVIVSLFLLNHRRLQRSAQHAE